MKRIAVISYDYPTRKAQEVLLRLKGNNYQQVDIYAIPFITRKAYKPSIEHRPVELLLELSNVDLASNLGYNYIPKEVGLLNKVFKETSYDAVLIAGAGLLPPELVKNHKIINSHPGYLPYVRGLDAVKWAVYEKLPIGVTVHFINEEADAGLLITQQKLEISQSDTFHSMCYKIWNLEMQLLVNSIELINETEEYKELSTTVGESHRRMPRDKEPELFIKFEEYKIFILNTN